MVLDSLVYEDFVQRLLYLDSVDDIRRAIKEGRGLDAKRLYQTLESLEKTSLEEGKIAQHSLLLFVHNVIDELLWRSGRESSSVDEISTSDELIHRALNAPNSLRAYRILRNHRHLLNKQVLDNIEKQIVVNRLETVNTDSWLMLLCLVALLLDDRPVVARGYLFWASYYGRTGRYRNAVRRLTHGVKVSEDLNDTWLKLTANSVQGDLYERMGEIVKAIESYTKALSLAESSGDELSAANIHGVLAYCYRSMGYYSVALEHINVYLSASQQLGGLPEEANRRLLKGVLLEDLGQYDEGEVEYQRAADLAGAKGDQGNQFVAMTDVAASFLKSGNTREAVKRFREIAQIVERWGNPVIISSSRNNLGNALLAMGRPSDAFREFDKALGTKISARLGYGAAISYIGMGDASEALGKHKDAQLFYMLAWMLFLETGDISIMDMCVPRIASGKMDVGENEVSIIHSAREQAMQRGDMFHELLFTSILIDQCLREDDEQQALAFYREAIERGKTSDMRSPQVMHLQIGLAKLLAKRSDGYQEAYELLTNILTRIEEYSYEIVLDQRRAEIVSEWIDLYGALIGVLVQGGDTLHLQNSINANELAFNLHESAKSRTFLASLANTVISLPESIPHSLQEREAYLLKLEQSLQDPASLHEFISPAYRLERLREINAELQACWVKIRPIAPEYVRLRSGEPNTLQDLQSLLSDQSGAPIAFVSFFCDEDSTTCFVMRSDEKLLHVFRSDIGRKALDEAAMRLRRAFNGAPDEFPPYPPIRGDRPWKRDKDLSPLFDKLSKALLKFLPAIQGVELLCVAPHGPLHLLPLHALRTPDEKFLIEHFAITYCPSLSTLRYCLSKQKISLSSVKPPSVYVAGTASRDDVHPEFFEHDDQIFNPRLWNITADMGVEAASKRHILQQLGGHDVVHLTCHGYFDDKDPLNSGLLFSNGSERPPRNPRSVSVMKRSEHILTIRDLLGTHMNAAMVTLRACSTGLQANRNSGDEFEGLNRALLYAGNAAVMVSLWNVDQQSSRQLLARFYQYWAESEKPLEKWRALWMAQKDFLNAQEPFLRHPYHWAPIVLNGDWR